MTTSTPSIIAADVVIEGNISTKGEIQLEGNIKGDLTCGSVVMGETGSIKGIIEADSVTIRGSVKGEIRARKVRLEKSALVEGDVFHENLSVESGAQITGHFSHSDNPIKKAGDETSAVPAFVKKKESEAAE
ncbi:polymer-forming cytoskeletal protein [Temperatibacter marinus]|uniref:Polymer-forming cytoskeletal protein n=1 Tax=Temperatibacter marinus TaxID=1456591 RepID=A0AA52EEQ6_9PROT|nr:polymer-forming cytoskeletal protein [Temperatibacter marinus]WND02278.1 polymer-forming cytoskeletal protein [Temperatibacter marinus]